MTQGGDGFRSQVDPEDPNTVYAAFAKRRHWFALINALASGLGIQPQPGRGEDPLRWNWDYSFHHQSAFTYASLLCRGQTFSQ